MTTKQTTRLFKNISWMGFDLVVVRQPPADISQIGTGQREIARLTWAKLEPNVHTEPTAGLDDAQCQQLIDDLFAAGFRPTEGRDAAGALSAMTAHLADMRQIAFNKLEVPKPEDKPTS